MWLQIKMIEFPNCVILFVGPFLVRTPYSWPPQAKIKNAQGLFMHDGTVFARNTSSYRELENAVINHHHLRISSLHNTGDLKLALSGMLKSSKVLTSSQ